MARVFWIGVGAGLALWGRHKAVTTYDKHVPPQVTEGVKKAGSSAKTFVGEVAKTQQQAREYLNNRRTQVDPTDNDQDDGREAD